MHLVNIGTNKEIGEQTVSELNTMFEAFSIPFHAEVHEVIVNETNWLTFEVKICFGNHFVTRFYYQFINNALANIKNKNRKTVASTSFEVVQIVYGIFQTRYSVFEISS